MCANTATEPAALAAPDVLTIEQLAARLHVKPRTVQYWRAHGKAPRALKVGKNVLFRLADVLEWEQQNLEEIPGKE